MMPLKIEMQIAALCTLAFQAQGYSPGLLCI